MQTNPTAAVPGPSDKTNAGLHLMKTFKSQNLNNKICTADEIGWKNTDFDTNFSL